MKALNVQNLSYEYRSSYQTVKAVNQVSFTFEPGRVYAIVGPSGSGKTTMLSLLAGLDLPTDGSILLDETPTSKMDRDAYRLQHISVIYQNFNLFQHLTVLENAAYPLYVRGIPRKQANQKATEKLLAVGLTEEQMKRRPATLSGGQQQRVAVARALASGSEIVLADEPTGNLDTANSQNIVEMLCSLAHKEHCCVIVVTHDPAVAEQADIVLEMRDGSIFETREQF